MQSAHYEVDLINFDNNNDVDDENLSIVCKLQRKRASERAYFHDPYYTSTTCIYCFNANVQCTVKAIGNKVQLYSC